MRSFIFVFALAVLTLFAACDEVTSKTSSQEYASCTTDADCKVGVFCAQYQSSTEGVCVLEESDFTSCSSDAECHGGICASLQNIDESVCIDPMPAEVEVPTCIFKKYDGLDYEVQSSTFTVLVEAHYIAETCELELREENASSDAFSYHMYLDEEGKAHAYGLWVAGEVTIRHFAVGLISLEETNPDTGFSSVIDFQLVFDEVNDAHASDIEGIVNDIHDFPYAEVTCHGTCRVSLTREDGTYGFVWYQGNGGEIITDGATLLDEYVTRDRTFYVLLTPNDQLTVELLAISEDWTAGPEISIRSTAARYSFGYYQHEGGEWVYRDRANVELTYTDVGVVYELEVKKSP